MSEDQYSGGGWIDREVTSARIFDAYVPRLVLHHLAREPFHPVRTVAGTMMFADLSGFTALSEKLQRRGSEGAELLVVTVNTVFEALLRIAYDNGGSLIKFGGDALLIFFYGEGHECRGANAAFRMRERLRTVGKLEVSGIRGVLRMTVGLHSDEFHFVLAGQSHKEHLVLGAGARGIVETEALAQNGQIVISAAVAAALPLRCLGPAVGQDGARLLRRTPLEHPAPLPTEDIPRPPNEVVGQALSTAVRAHVMAGRAAPEHRRASVAFLQFAGANAIIESAGIDAAAAKVHELVVTAQQAADAWEICFLDSDVDADGGKLLFTAGAPRVVGDDEERMLLAMRQIIDARAKLSGPQELRVRIGVNRGPVFTGELGPYYRRSYIVMGDTTNLAARVMGKSKPGTVWATPGILERSTTRFDTVKLEPFAAKGKARLVQAYQVGHALRATTASDQARERAALTGRGAQTAVLEARLSALGDRAGAAITLIGEAGVGKTRLLEWVRERGRVLDPQVHQVRAACEAHTALTPYGPWQTLLPALMGLAPTTTPAQAYAAAAARCAGTDLANWAPLIADVLGHEVEPTAAVAALSPEFRQARVHEVLWRFLAPERTRPTVLEIDNAHLLDESSAALLRAVLATLARLPWLVVLAGRPAGFAELGAQRLELAPLSPDDAVELAQAVTDAAPLPAHVLDEAVARSGGNPQFLLDLLDAAAGGGGELPESAAGAAMALIDALAPSDRTVVRRLSVLGTSFHPQRLPGLGIDPDPQIWARLAGVFDSDPSGRMSFRRTAVAEAAYSTLPFGARRAMHAELAAALEADSSAAPDPAALARHHRAAGAHEAALPYTVAAAQRSLTRGAAADAARLFRAALDSALTLRRSGAELAPIFDGLGVALRRAGEGRAAEAVYRQARSHSADPVRRAELYYRQARLAHREGRYSASVRTARAGRRALEGARDPDAIAWRACLLSNEAADRLRQGRLGASDALCRAALAEAAHAGDGAQGPRAAQRAAAHAGYLLDWTLVERERSAEAVYSERAREIYASLGDLEDLANVENNLGMFAYWDGRWDDAVARYRVAAELSERIGDVMGVGFGDCNIGEVLADQGRWVEAEAALRRALRAWRSVGDEAGGGFARMLLGRALTRAGRDEEGTALLATAAGGLAADALDPDDAVLAQCYLAEAHAYAGRAEAARAVLGAVEDSVPPRQRALVARVHALALAPDTGAACTALAAAYALGREISAEHDAAVAADALIGLGADPGGEYALARAELSARLGIVAFPALPSFHAS
ncbi:MAG: adenylate/guanylate cyclase domain-containing protein [Sporichthyaceae bacterium]